METDATMWSGTVLQGQHSLSYAKSDGGKSICMFAGVIVAFDPSQSKILGGDCALQIGQIEQMLGRLSWDDELSLILHLSYTIK